MEKAPRHINLPGSRHPPPYRPTLATVSDPRNALPLTLVRVRVRFKRLPDIRTQYCIQFMRALTIKMPPLSLSICRYLHRGNTRCTRLR
jgi:hypothetical protein